MTAPDQALAIITARGGSKRLPGKNLMPLAGRPLIAWTIAAARACPAIDRVVVTTDDETIAQASRAAGAEVPFLRPPALATDTAKSTDVLRHAVDALGAAAAYRYLVLLQPTSPLRTAADIAAALALARAREAASVISVSPSPVPPAHLAYVAEDGGLSPVVPTDSPFAERRSQDMRPAFRINGAIYVARIDWFLAGGRLIGPETLGYVMPAERSVDIDDALDFHLAEACIAAENR